MLLKWIGAVCIVAACGGFSLMLAYSYKNEERTLRQLISAIDFMECELKFRMSALPELCMLTANVCDGTLQKVFVMLANDLEDQVSVDVARGMNRILNNVRDIPLSTYDCLQLLGTSLGRFDLEGQLKGLDMVRQECRLKLSRTVATKQTRLRSYQTLGLCGGAALIILLM